MSAHPADPSSFDFAERLRALLAHSQALVGASLADLAESLGMAVPPGTVRTKGWSGQIIERELGGGEETHHGPDFAALGVELKTVPVNTRGVPQESTAVCQIDPIAVASESWETSYVRRKLARVLFVTLVAAPKRRGTGWSNPTRKSVPSSARKSVPSSVGDRRVGTVRLWSPSPAQDHLLRCDFELFARNFFRTGRAADLTGHLGRVLQVRPKGRNASDTRQAFGSDGLPTRIGKCGFYLRPAFVSDILNEPAFVYARQAPAGNPR